MGHWRPDFISELDPDIPADLTYPDRFSLKAHWTQPYPKMVALMDSVARFLPGKILLSFIEIEGTDGRVSVSCSKQVRFYRLAYRFFVCLFGWEPSSTSKGRCNIFATSNEN